MADNEKISGVPIEDDALENAVGGVSFPLSEEDIRNIKPVSPMDAIDKDVLKVNNDSKVMRSTASIADQISIRL